MGNLKKKNTCSFQKKKILNIFFYMIITPLQLLRATSYRTDRLKKPHLQSVFIYSDDIVRCQLNILDIKV